MDTALLTFLIVHIELKISMGRDVCYYVLSWETSRFVEI